MNSWKTKWHDNCKASYTVNVSAQIKELIVQNEERSKKDARKRFKLISLESKALFDPLNYQLICAQCSPSNMCSRHGHISFCTDRGPKPNTNAAVTKNGPKRVCQRLVSLASQYHHHSLEQSHH